MDFPIWILLPTDCSRAENLFRIRFDGGRIGTPVFESEQAAIAAQSLFPNAFNARKLASAQELLAELDVIEPLGVEYVIFGFSEPQASYVAIREFRGLFDGNPAGSDPRSDEP